jgi:inorganic phosphate transporter, PiT family
MTLLVSLIVIALVFDFMNGRNDAANSIATIVSTRVLSPGAAVAWAAFFNFIAFLVFGLSVASTVGRGIIAPDAISDHVIFGALIGAISWQVVTGYFGIPSSSSHALIGGLVGAGLQEAGLSAVVWQGLAKTASGIVLSPTVGMMLALGLVLIISWSFVRVARHLPQGAVRLGLALRPRPRRERCPEDHGNHHRPALCPRPADRRVPRPVLGGGDLQRGDGAGYAAGRLAHHPHHGLAHHAASTPAGRVRGDGGVHDPVRRADAVRWSVAREILIAWVVTMPAAASVGASFCWLSKFMW